MSWQFVMEMKGVWRSLCKRERDVICSREQSKNTEYSMEVFFCLEVVSSTKRRDGHALPLPSLSGI